MYQHPALSLNSMKRNWVYDEIIKKALAFARKKGLDLGTEIANVPLEDIDSEGSVLTISSMVDAIKEAVAAGDGWPKSMPLALLACDSGKCITLDGNHRIKAARAAGAREIPVIVVRRSTWEAMFPVIAQEDIIPYDDFIAVLAEAGSEDIRRNLRLEEKAREEFP